MIALHRTLIELWQNVRGMFWKWKRSSVLDMLIVIAMVMRLVGLLIEVIMEG